MKPEMEKVRYQPDHDNGGEQWSQYVLEDGTVLRVRAMVSSVFRVKGQFAPNGDPQYQVNMQNVLAIEAPENLKQVQAP